MTERELELFEEHQRLVGDGWMVGWNDCRHCLGTGRVISHPPGSTIGPVLHKCPTCEMRYLQESVAVLEQLKRILLH